MEQPATGRPVDRAGNWAENQISEGGEVRNRWPEQSLEQAQNLHRLLAIGDRDWHAHKGQPARRAAEQLAGALVQLLGADGPSANRSSEGRRQAMALTANALAWLEGELRDPGCPDHGR